jgi:hypothetical protein
MQLFMDVCRAATPALFEWLGRRFGELSRASDDKTAGDFFFLWAPQQD